MNGYFVQYIILLFNKWNIKNCLFSSALSTAILNFLFESCEFFAILNVRFQKLVLCLWTFIWNSSLNHHIDFNVCDHVHPPDSFVN